MPRTQSVQRTCAVCGKQFAARLLVSGDTVRDSVAELILRDHPDWSPDSCICRDDLSKYRADYVESLLESERGELTSLEEEVLESLREHEVIATNVDVEFEREWTFGERAADRIATFGGSWTFLALFAVLVAVWSTLLMRKPVDPYPYILLNLVLSCVAAIQAPVIMMSQNRQEAKDRLRSQNDYQVNLKAELEIRHLNDKLDHLLSRQWDRLIQIQQIQLQLLSELEKR